MGNVEMVVAGILRFSLIAFVLLGACLCVVRWVNQPLERIRLIQISVVALLVTVALSVVNVVPTVDLAWLPSAESPETISSPAEPAPGVAAAKEPYGQLSIPPSFVADELAGTDDLEDASGMLDPANESSVTTATDKVNRDFSFLPLLGKLLAIAFLVVSFLNLAYLAVGFIATRRLLSTSMPLSEAARARVERIVTGFPTKRTARCVSSSSIDVPMVVGMWRPTVLLPESLTRIDADQLELKHSLAHEWGHIELHDLVTWQLVSLCQTFLWVQPFYWILRRELRVAQDQLADQFATDQTYEHACYATTLLELSRSRQRVLPGALTMAGGKSNLYRRIEMLMNKKFPMVRAARKSIMLSFAILLAVTGGLMISVQLTQATSPLVLEPANQSDQDDEKTAVAKDDNKKSAEHSGIVVDADTGKPIAGVTVTVTRMESSNWQELAVTNSTTDENGKYTFTIPPEQLSQRLLYIMFDIDHPDYARRHCGSYGYGMIVKNLEDGEQPWFSELEMVRGEKIFGRLVDENKQPISGAQIRSSSAPQSGFHRVRSSSTDEISDQDGRFELVATHDGITKISIVPSAHCMKYVDIGENRGDIGDIGDITLDTGFPINGVVKDAKGKPMSGLWVNITPEEERGASSEMKRSCKTNEQGEFTSRPVKNGKYLIEVQTKATGAIEKLKYANFHDTPPTAMFVNRSINLTEDSARKPLVVQAVPHVLITVRHFSPKGEISSGHSPSLMGKFDGQRMWIRKGRRTGKGAFELMAPHGFEDADLRFMTNEHSALMVQFEDGELTPQDSFRFKRIEGDIDNIRVVRHPAGILKLNIVDESGKQLEDGGIFAQYELDEQPDEKMMMATQIGWNKEDGMFRLSSIVPGAPVSVRFNAAGFQTQTQKFTMNEGERRTVTIKLEKGNGEKTADED